MSSRIQYQQLLRLAHRQTLRQQQQQHVYARRLPFGIAAQCLPQAALFSTTRPRPQEVPPKLTTAGEPEPPIPQAQAQAQTDPASNPNPEPKKKKKSLIGRLIFPWTFILVGIALGRGFTFLVEPPEPLAPDTEEDAYMIEVLQGQAAKLPIVKQLDSDPSFSESWDAYETLTEKHKSQHLMAGVMKGSRGVCGYQRIWYSPSTGELVSVVFLGGATTGWPGVVHGGLLATILDESCGRAAFKAWGGKLGVTAKLELNYKRATLANGFYVIRARPREEDQLPEEERGKRHYKIWVDGTVEDANTGEVKIISEAIFVGGSGKNAKKEKRVWERTVNEHARF